MEYDMFNGFDIPDLESSIDIENNNNGSSSDNLLNLQRTTISSSTDTTYFSTQNITTIKSITSEIIIPSISTEPLKVGKNNCSEEERPMNLGTFEVPTKLDVAKFIQQTLTRIFNSYHEKALNLLQDIKEATRATSGIEKKCHGDSKLAYKQCVKSVQRKSLFVTKSLVLTLEKQRHDVSDVIENIVCNKLKVKEDPINFIKLLAVEEASLEFALPGFLRLLGSCSSYCTKYNPTSAYQKPSRHMTDQDLVIKHFLTKKNYLQLIKGDQKKEVKGN